MEKMAAWEDYKMTMAGEENIFDEARYGDVGALEAYLLNGGDIEARNHRGYSLLMLSVYNGHLAATEFLLSKGADYDSVDNSGNSVLMTAAFKGHFEIASLLLEAGADTTLRNHHDMSAADFARLFGRRNILALLREEPTEWKDPFKVAIRVVKRKGQDLLENRLTNES
jgi:ankyrin repeat protein